MATKPPKVRLPDLSGVQQYMLELSHDVHTKVRPRNSHRQSLPAPKYGGRHSSQGHIQWFYFSVSNTTAKQEVIFYIRGFSKKESLFSVGMRPLMFSEMFAASEGKGGLCGPVTPASVPRGAAVTYT
eukprot:scaffold494_cov245-Pinguiococcus_pyrenoidosus.AAC.9